MIPEIAYNSIQPYFKVSVYSKLVDIGTKPPVSIFTDTGINAVTSFSISEKEREATTGSITCVDLTGAWNDILKSFSVIDIEWGLKTLPRPIFSFDGEVNGKFKRRIAMHIINKSVSCADGLVTYNFGLKAGQLAKDKDKVYNSGTLKDMLIEVFKDMGYDQKNITIDFKKMNQRLSSTNQESSVGMTSLRFIYYLTTKYNLAVFYQTDNSDNPLKVYVIDYGSTLNLPNLRGLTGNSHVFNYGTNKSNCLSIDFDMNNNGSFPFAGGSQVIVDPSGNVRVEEKTPDEKIITYRINMDKIRAEMKGNPSDTIKKVTEIVTADFETDWERLKKEYFIPSITTTVSPSGMGWTASCKVVPNPLYQVGDKVDLVPKELKDTTLIPGTFKSLSDKKLLWRISGVEQTINSDGYEMTLEIAK